jgi:four helix bundle protein
MANGEWRMGDLERRDRADAVKSYRDLRVWQEAMSLAVDCYKLTRAFPKDELFGMTAQIRRASASIAANIAEGHGRESTGAFIQFLRIAQGSLKELETHLLLAERVSIISIESLDALMTRCGTLGRRVRHLIRALQKKAETA